MELIFYHFGIAIPCHLKTGKLGLSSAGKRHDSKDPAKDRITKTKRRKDETSCYLLFIITYS